MRYLILIVMFLMSHALRGQESSFHLDYQMVGLDGKSIYNFFPLVSIDGLQMTYVTSEKKTGRHMKTIRRSSVDSIIKIVEQLQDTVIFRSNLCVLGAVVVIV